MPAKKARFDSLRLGVSWPRDVLAKRIDERIDMRLEQGMIEEVQRLMDEGASVDFLLGLGLEYDSSRSISSAKFRIRTICLRSLPTPSRNSPSAR